MGQNRNHGQKTRLQVDIQLNQELDSITNQAVVKILCVAMADEAVLSAKIRCAQWNVRGVSFFGLKSLYAGQYKQLSAISDGISKRARILNQRILGSYDEFLKDTRLHEEAGIVPGILEVTMDHENLAHFLQEDASKCSEELKDEITHDILVSFQDLHEKMARSLRKQIDRDKTSNMNSIK
jgi:DNA-binding ferritin-like protein